jgi:hypothetical protein
VKGGFWHFRYPLADGVLREDGLDYIVVATTRPKPCWPTWPWRCIPKIRATSR